MLKIHDKRQFRRDSRKLRSSGKNLSKLATVIDSLAAEGELDPKYQDHPLIGNYVGHRECHIAPDWLLIYKIKDGYLILVRTGSHSELF